MNIKIDSIGSNHPPIPISITCPVCKKVGIFNHPNNNIADLVVRKYYLGHRMCPNKECKAHVFIIHEPLSGELHLYPPSKIDFNSENIPSNIVETFEEAITCHSNECYKASALMVRKTLEEICMDKEATGYTLKEKLKNLSKIILIPSELISGMEILRLLGNDAAHTEVKDFPQISQRELEVAITFTKEILKAVYQYSALLKELESLKLNQ